ncbi:MAG: peptidylprolyl isomerase [Vicinamibacterales bacterium]
MNTAVVCLSLVLVVAVPPLAAQQPVPSHAPAAPASIRTEVARVNGVAVTSDRLAAALATLIPQESFHRNVDAHRMAELRTQALSSVIDDELAYQDGLRRGLRAAPADVRKAWDQTVARYGGPAAFTSGLRQSGLSRTSVEREIARQLIVEQNYGDSVTKGCRVTAVEARRFFGDHPERFVEPEQLHVQAITVAVNPSSPPSAWSEAKARAAQARAALDEGTTFDEAARSYSTDPSREKGGDMGFVHRGSLASPFDEVVERLPAGGTSAVVESLYGYHILRVSEVRPPQAKSFEQVSTPLMNDLSVTRCAERKDAWLAQLRTAARIERLEGAQ